MALVVIGTLLYVPLLDRHGFHSHEDATTYLRVVEYGREIQAGHWIPQTLPSLFSGGGYAFPRFYPPFAYGVAVALTAATSDVVLGVHLSFLASVLLSVLTMYIFVTSITRDRLVGLLGAIAYISFPYRFQDVFVRGALAECWSFIWYPLILLGGWRIRQGGRVPWYLPIAGAGLVLSHSQMALYFGVVCVLLLACARPLPSSPLLLRYLVATCIGLGLAAWFWIPQKYYLSTVWAGDPALVWADAEFVNSQRVSLLTLLTGMPLRNAMALSVGGVGLLAQVLALVSWILPASDDHMSRLRGLALWLLIPWWALLLFMISPKIVLGMLPAAFGYIQFPWRLLGPMGLLSASSLALLIASWRSKHMAFAGLLAVGALVLPSGIVPNTLAGWTSSALTQELSGPRAEGGLTSVSEYLPRTVGDLRSDYDGTIGRLKRAISLGPQASPGILVRSFVRNGSSSETRIEADRPGEIILPIIYYDFYSAHLRGGSKLSLRDSSGFVAFSLPPGDHIVLLSEHVTAVQWIALAASLCTVLIYLRVVFHRTGDGRRVT
jgi:hypothetical protein